MGQTATGGIDMGFRNYDPGLNQFLTRDMYNGALADMRLGLDPWNANRYAFAGGNPITRVELDGHILIEDWYRGSGSSSGGSGDDAPATSGSGGDEGGSAGNTGASEPPVWCDSSGVCGTVAGSGDSPQQPSFDLGGATREVGLAGCSWLPVLGWGCDGYDMKRTVEEDGLWSLSSLASVAGFFPFGDAFKLPRQADNIGDAANSGSAMREASQAAFKAAENPGSIFVKNKHLASAGGNGAKFKSDDIGEVQGWVSRGLQSDSVQFLPNGLDDTFRAIVPGGGVVGTRGQEFIRVIVTGDGRVINAFPVHVR